MSTPTTPSVILEDFVTQIKAIAPAEVAHSDERFRFVRSREQVPGAAVRTFTLEIEPTGDGVIVGCGNDYTFNLRVVTSYAGLQRYKAQCFVQEDNRQIFQTLALRAGPLTGLQAVTWTPPGFEYDDQTDGKIWGSHVFQVRYIAGPGPTS